MSEIRADQLPAFQAWSKQFTPPSDTYAYIDREVSVTTTAIITELFFPELISVRGCVILASRYEPSNFDDWWKHTGEDRTAVERVLNHLHLWDLFEPSDEHEEWALDAIADRIAQSWRCHAAASFPDRSFEVTVTDEYGPTIIMNTRPST